MGCGMDRVNSVYHSWIDALLYLQPILGPSVRDLAKRVEVLESTRPSQLYSTSKPIGGPRCTLTVGAQVMGLPEIERREIMISAACFCLQHVLPDFYTMLDAKRLAIRLGICAGGSATVPERWRQIYAHGSVLDLPDSRVRCGLCLRPIATGHELGKSLAPTHASCVQFAIQYLHPRPKAPPIDLTGGKAPSTGIKDCD